MITEVHQEIANRLVDAAVAYFPGMTREAVLGRDRGAQATACRAAVAYTLRKSGWLSSDIGRALNRDPTTINHLIVRHERGAYPSTSLPGAVEPPRDIGTWIGRVMALEERIVSLESGLASVERSFVRRTA